jgi:hypothetical protein
MTLKSPTAKKPAEQVIKDIRRVTRRGSGIAAGLPHARNGRPDP